MYFIIMLESHVVEISWQFHIYEFKVKFELLQYKNICNTWRFSILNIGSECALYLLHVIIRTVRV